MRHDFLFELGTEELPSAAVKALSESLCHQLETLLSKEQLTYQTVHSYATPRRLAIYITALDDQQPAKQISRKGPMVASSYNAAKQPTAALLGFAKSCAVAVEQLVIKLTDKGDAFFYEIEQPGQRTEQLMPILIGEALTQLPIVKPMRWGDGDSEFARPVHWLCMLYADKVLPFEMYGIKSGDVTYGHRFLAPDAIVITQPSSYEPLLYDAKVIVDFSKRRSAIEEQIGNLANSCDTQAIVPSDLLDEVTSIVEWPHGLLAQFDKKFLEVPKEVLIASMQAHQKCFALEKKNGTLDNHFITISNIESKNPRQVIAGNERVMHARLSDAAFFYMQDRKRSLASYIDATKTVIYQTQLGSLYDKTQRMLLMVQSLETSMSLKPQEVIRAVELSKCDLLSGMIGEFPELQGVMGRYYALADNESSAVSLAIEEQYLPRFAKDNLPKTFLGTALSLADRLDTLIGIYLIGGKPTGMKDPFKLRRHALAVVRMLIATSLPLSLDRLIDSAWQAYPASIRGDACLKQDIKQFILERIYAYYEAKNIRAAIVSAVLAKQNDDLADFAKRLLAMVDFISYPESQRLSAACKRVHNILQTVPEVQETRTVNMELLSEPAEKHLWQQMVEQEGSIAKACQEANYIAALKALAQFDIPLNIFFETIRVMGDDLALQNNRIALLHRLLSLLQKVADISLLITVI